MPTRARFGSALLLGGLFFGTAACTEPAPRWNVLLVTFDTTRADHIGAYGHGSARTPVVDGLAAAGTLFEQAMAPVPITLPSHSSLMTGKVPLAHGVRDNGLFALGDEQVTLAETLRDAGCRTGAAIGSFPEMLVQAEVRLGNYDGALELLQQMRARGEAYPSAADLLRQESAVYFFTGDVPRGHAKLAAAEALDPTADGHYRLALYQQYLGDAAAADFFDGALELDPDFVPARVDRAIQRVMARDLTAAEADLERAVADDPFFARGHYNYAALLLETGRPEAAARHFRRAAHLRPRYLEARAALVEVLLGLDQRPEAAAEAEALRALAPNSAEAQRALQLIGAPS